MHYYTTVRYPWQKSNLGNCRDMLEEDGVRIQFCIRATNETDINLNDLDVYPSSKSYIGNGKAISKY